MVEDITPKDLAQRMESDEKPQVLDVREDIERDIACIPGSLHIPMQQVPARVAELDRDRPIVIYCHHGMRSYQVACYLHEQGFAKVYSLGGGIDGYAMDVDPAMTRY